MISSNDTHQPPTEKLTIRLLIEHPTLGWRPISDVRSSAIYRGEKAVPEFAGKTIRMATVILAIEGQSKSLRRIEITHLKFLDDGHFDGKGFMARIIEKINKGMDEKSTNDSAEHDTLTSTEIQSICHALGMASPA